MGKKNKSREGYEHDPRSQSIFGRLFRVRPLWEQKEGENSEGGKRPGAVRQTFQNYSG